MEIKENISEALKYHLKADITGRDVLYGDQLIFNILDDNKNDYTTIEKLADHFTHELSSFLPSVNANEQNVIIEDEIDESINQIVMKIDNNFVKNEVIRLINGKKKKLRSRMMSKILSKNNYFLLGYVELLHLASLIQDDVIDKATTRRFVDTINNIYDDQTAVVVSDMLLMTLMVELAKFYDEKYSLDDKIYELHYDAFQEMIKSEMTSSVNDLDEYFKYSQAKTGNLFALALSNSYYIEKQSLVQYDEYYAFGIEYGTVFQIVDDFIDHYSEETKTGKTKTDIANDSPNYFKFVDEKTKTEHINSINKMIDDLFEHKLAQLFKEEIMILHNSINEER